MSSTDDDSSSDDETYVPSYEEEKSEDERSENCSDDKSVTEIKKEKVDELWASFKEDDKCCTNVRKAAEPAAAKTTVKVTKVYDFAGEEVQITKEVAKNSKEAKNNTQNAVSVKAKRPGGLQGILGKMNKKPKLSTLEKSKLDWSNYKEEEGISDELRTYNKGKDGFIQKKLFLERTDFRQFEKERDMRLMKSGKR